MKMEHKNKPVRLRSDSSAYLFPPIQPKSASVCEGETPPVQPKDNLLSERPTKSELLILPSIKVTHAAIANIKGASDFDPEADYDFEQDDDARVRRPYWERVPRNLAQCDILKGYYRRACEKEDVPPSAKFLDQIGSGYIVMRGVGLGRKAFKAICACAMHLDLTGLNLSGNSLGAIEMSYLTQLLRKKRNVKDLILADNNINGRALATLAQFLSSFKNTQLRILDLSGNKLTDDDGQNIANIIQYNTDLEEVYLSRNELREHGPLVISTALADNESLDLLDMSWNHIRTAGAVAVANSIGQNTKLKTLRVAWNGFGYEGSLAMGHALVHNRTLTELDLSNNRIHPPALFGFMADMLKNQTLTTLKLACNPIPVCYTSPLLALIARRKDVPLKLLDLSGVIVDPQFESLLEDLKCVRDITVLYDRSVPIHKKKWAQMLDECKSNDEPKVINIDPVRTLYLLKQNLRCIDMLVQMDRDESYDLSREEIKLALDRHGLTVSSSALDTIMSYLDTNKDGSVDLRELIDGERRLTREQFARQEDLQKKGVDTAPFSKTFKGNAIKGLDEAVSLVIERVSTSETVKEKPDSSEHHKGKTGD